LEDRRILIDTSVVIDHFRKKNKQKSLLYELSKENTLFLSAISKRPKPCRSLFTVHHLLFNGSVCPYAFYPIGSENRMGRLRGST